MKDEQVIGSLEYAEQELADEMNSDVTGTTLADIRLLMAYNSIQSAKNVLRSE